MPTFYAVEIEKENLAGELRLNDVPLYIWRDRGSLTKGQPVNMWITGRSGNATFVFDWRNVAPDLPVQGAKLKIAIFTGTNRSQPAREARELARLDWRADAQAPRPASVTVDFSCDDPPPSVFWADARKLRVDDDSTLAVLALLRELNGALERREIPRVVELLRYKTIDVGRSLYNGDTESIDGLREFLEFSMEAPGWGMEPIEVQSVELHLAAGGRLIWATRKGGEPVLQSRAGRYPRLQLPVYAAPVRGRWTVVR